ncbi:hypothetical protein RUND412_009804 [Rhizina undulata]
MPHASLQPPVDFPADVPIWTFFFSQNAPSSTKGFIDAPTGTLISYLQVKIWSTYLSTALVRKYGLQPGDVVSVLAGNNIWYPIGVFGVLRVGGIISTSNPQYTVHEMSYALKTAGSKYIFTTPSSLPTALKVAEEARLENFRERVFLLEGEEPGYRNLKELVEAGRKLVDDGQGVEEWSIEKGRKNGDFCAFLGFSSGTTGLPKAVMISHQNVIAQCFQVRVVTTADLDRVLGVLPLFHITGIIHILHFPLLISADVIMMPTYSLPTLLQTVVKYQLKELLVVPPILIRLVRDPEVLNYDLSHVRRFSTGAAPLAREIVAELHKRFPRAGLKQAYGMTESCSCITATLPGDCGYRWAHTVGSICASTTVKIVDNNGNEVPLGEPGEILAKGPQVVMGYLNNPAATASTIDASGYLHTGDLGSIDANGMIMIRDRLKEMIKVKGIPVAPAELEDLLLGHPLVEDCAVLGVPDEYAGEVPRAFVVTKKGLTEQEKLETERVLVGYVQEKVNRAKWLKGGVEFLESVPKSASGKILRRVLRDRFGKGKKARL